MLIIFVCGMPSSGKSSLSKLLLGHLARAWKTDDIQMIEMSSVVKEWQALLGRVGDKAVLHTDQNSAKLYHILWDQIGKKDISIVSGVRERFLLSKPTQFRKAQKIELSLQMDSVSRHKLYLSRPSNSLTFEESEERALFLGVPMLLHDIEHKIVNTLNDPQKALSDALRIILTETKKEG